MLDHERDSGVWRAGMISKALFMTGVAGVVTLLNHRTRAYAAAVPQW